MPVLKLRYVVAGVLIVGSVIAGPLLVVRKQVYLRDLAIRREHLNDSLTAANRCAAELNIEVRRLSSQHRIERLAREQLDMEYPESHQIVIVEDDHGRGGRGGNDGFMAVLKRSLGKGRS